MHANEQPTSAGDAAPGSAPRATRRTFLQQAAAVSGMAVVAGVLPAGAARARASTLAPPRDITTSKKDKLRLAYVGTGGMGGAHLNETKDLGIVCPCYCDVDTDRMEEAKKFFPEAKAYQDYREMYEKEANNFDAVMVGTPDHHHYPATILAMRLGKHVYTQKPLTHTPWEARQLALAADKYQLATQMGNQGHAGEGWRLVYEWIRGGALGDIIEAHSWTDRPIWPQGLERPEKTDPVPGSLNWDVWLGPAPERPFAEKAYHPFAWRGWWDFGAGALGDMACHTLDGIFWALDPGHASAIEPVTSSDITADAFPNASVVKWEFPASAMCSKGFAMYWYDGGLKPRMPANLEMGRRLNRAGNLIMGTKASIIIGGDYGESPRIFPEDKMKEIGKPKQLLERSPGHYAEWIMACKGEQPIDFPKSRFAYAAPMTETILLGNVALRLGRRLEWDGAKMQFTNVPEANQYVSKEYRKGWDVGPA